MVQEPGLQLRVEAATRWDVAGPLVGRVNRAAESWRLFHGLPALPECHVAIDHAPPEHVGLGLGTQLALSVAAGLSAFCGLPAGAPQELALSVGRGQRSAIGTYGFALGGLIVERGKLRSEPISPLDTRLALPAAWRFVLVRPVAACGLSGARENAALESTAAAAATTQELIHEVREQLIPAVAQADFAPFADSLFRYSALAGSFYSQQQGGPYNGPVLTALVARIRAWGHAGVGQSSWGPTLFVAQADDDSAQSLADRLRREWDGSMLDVVIAQPDNAGAQIQMARPVSGPPARTAPRQES